jgi:ATP-dependent exoDNAse (exonuclease V) beta subunit
VRVPGTDEVIAALNKEDRANEVKEALKTSRRQEMERLLYVAVTRARHTLVLALDQELFARSDGSAHDNSQLKFLRGATGAASATILDALTETCAECSTTRAAWNAAAADASPASELQLLIGAEQVANASRRAAEFPRKQNPSGLEPAREEPRVISAVARAGVADNPATLYGSWWHSLFEHFPWRQSSSAWQAAFEAMQTASPDPERSAREWRLLIRGGLRDSTLGEFLRRDQVLVHTEMPFLWRMDEQSCMEGVIDLLLVDVAQRECLLVDWKTDNISARDEVLLHERHGAQLAAYWRAVRAITGCDVQVLLYSTALGKLLPIEPTPPRAEIATCLASPNAESRSCRAAGAAPPHAPA